MSYFDGYLATVPVANREAYREQAQKAAGWFKEYGALKVVETWGTDVPEGKVNSFHTAVMRKPDEAVVFAWVEWPSKEVRDAAWKKLMDDPRMETMTMPYDGTRMIYGGFESLLEA